MRKMNILLSIAGLIFGFLNISLAQKTQYNGWFEEEDVFSKVLAMRAKELEKKSMFRFDNDFTPKAEFQWRLGSQNNRGGNSIAAEYVAKTQSIHFQASLISEINVKYKSSLRLMDPIVLAKDEQIGKLIDHELGHMLMDQVSRRNKLGQWFTLERFYNLSREERLGLNIISEGVATYFEHIRYPTKEKLSAEYFPATFEEQRIYTFEMVVFSGGYYLVRDILKEHGEEGLIWLISHPFVAKDDNMREAAVLYRTRALAELKKKSP